MVWTHLQSHAKIAVVRVFHQQLQRSISDYAASGHQSSGTCRGNIPNDPESALPGVVVGVFVEDGKSGRLFAAQDFCGLSLVQAVEKAEKQKGVY